MSDHNYDTNTIVQRFNALRWHDAKLTFLSFHRNEDADEEEVSINVGFAGENGVHEIVCITFMEASTINMQVDLEGKRVCSDSIATADCSNDSDWINSLAVENPYDNFSGFLHFKIILIPPGGIINILAKNFIIKRVATRS